MSENTSSTDEALRQLFKAKQDACTCTEELAEPECTCRAPWWHKAGKVAALLLLANALGLIWVNMLGLAPYTFLSGFTTFLLLILSAIVGLTSDNT